VKVYPVCKSQVGEDRRAGICHCAELDVTGASRGTGLNWPTRASVPIAADLEADPHLVQTVLQQHITDLLTEAANRFDPPGIGGRSDG